MFPPFSVVIIRHRGFRIAPLHIQHIRPFSGVLDEEAADQAHVAAPKLPEDPAKRLSSARIPYTPCWRFCSCLLYTSPVEVRLRVAARTKDRANAAIIGNEVEALYTNGPAGGGGAVKSVREIISIASILIPREDVQIHVEYKEVGV